MKHFFCIILALALMCGCALAETGELIRLHVVADNDTADARALKMELRDVCLACAKICIGGAENADEAYMLLNRHLCDFQSVCENRARELGYEGKVHVETGKFSFPDRIYGKVLVPAGEYRALRVTVGSGEGHNWWCVLYPQLCILNEEHYAGDKPCYSSVWNWLKSRIGGI